MVIALQLAAIAGFGALTVARSAVPGPVDEHAHVSYVEYVAKKHRTPAITDPMSPEVAAIEKGTWPHVVRGDPRTGGLTGTTYEGFQPPLYYVLAAPAFLVPSNYITKIRAVRSFDLLILLVGAAVLWPFARSVFGDPERSMFAYSVALNAFLLPGVIRRAVQVSNAGLEMVAALVVLWLLWEAHTRRSDARLLAAAVALGLALLTKLTLVWLVPLFAVVLVLRLWRDRSGRAIATVAACAAIPLLLLAPWLAMNERRYHSLTANAQARAQQRQPKVNPSQQQPKINPSHQQPKINRSVYHYGVGDLPDRDLNIIDVVTPQEWTPPFGIGSSSALVRSSRVAGWLVVAAVVLLLPGWLGWTGRLLLVGPLIVALALLNLTLLRDNWDILLPRSLYPTLPPLGLAAAASADRVLRSERARAAVVVTLAIILVAAWGWFMAGHA
jgi:4-amino-4-deoxy-L-arabinose transferase-like glycosyltransferase